MANEAFSPKSASVRWAGWATVTYGRVGKLKTRVGKRKNFFRRFAPNFAHPGLKPCRRPWLDLRSTDHGFKSQPLSSATMGKLLTHMCVHLSASSIIWYQSMGGDRLAAWKVTVGLASHWPCVTDNLPPTGRNFVLAVCTCTCTCT